ncbi:MAG: DUF1566 domain-containing protein [Deltaproteobacteria bacterium]|jgi:hypothetical protein|nr:DUF1566 domain-containing protein [Deltaproteobacteria bacterium]
MTIQLSGFVMFIILLAPVCAGAANKIDTDETAAMQSVENTNRFDIVFNGAAILDHSTGFVWEQSPDPALMSWDDAVNHCENLELANKKDWRLATLEELTSLIDSSVLGSPKLPELHPFDTGCKLGGCVQADTYWTGTPLEGNSAQVWGVCFCNGSLKQSSKNYDNFAWCLLDETDKAQRSAYLSN